MLQILIRFAEFALSASLKWKLRVNSAADLKAQRSFGCCCATFLLWWHTGTIHQLHWVRPEKGLFAFSLQSASSPSVASNAGQSTPESLLFIALPPAASHHNEGMDEEDWYSYKCCPGFNWQKQKVLTNAMMPLSRLVSHSGPIEKCVQNITMRRNWSRQVSKVLPLSIMAMSIPD